MKSSIWIVLQTIDTLFCEFYKIIQNWDEQYGTSLSDCFNENSSGILGICKEHLCDTKLIDDYISHKAVEQ